MVRHGRHGDPGDRAHVDRPLDPAATVPRDLRGLAGARPSVTETWTRVLQVHARVGVRLDAALRAQHGLSLQR